MRSWRERCKIGTGDLSLGSAPLGRVWCKPSAIFLIALPSESPSLGTSPHLGDASRNLLKTSPLLNTKTTLESAKKEGEFYDETKIKLPDSLKYRTASGRIVYGGGGIIPDIFLPVDTTTRLSACAEEAQRKNLFLLTAQEYVNAHPELKKAYASAADFAQKYQLTPEVWALFEKKAKDAGLTCNSMRQQNQI